METGRVTLDANTTAPAIVIGEEGDNVILWVFLETGPIRFVAARGEEPDEGVFVSD